jgi:hypothetical protein
VSRSSRSGSATRRPSSAWVSSHVCVGGHRRRTERCVSRPMWRACRRMVGGRRDRLHRRAGALAPLCWRCSKCDAGEEVSLEDVVQLLEQHAGPLLSHDGAFAASRVQRAWIVDYGAFGFQFASGLMITFALEDRSGEQAEAAVKGMVADDIAQFGSRLLREEAARNPGARSRSRPGRPGIDQLPRRRRMGSGHRLRRRAPRGTRISRILHAFERPAGPVEQRVPGPTDQDLEAVGTRPVMPFSPFSPSAPDAATTRRR